MTTKNAAEALVFAKNALDDISVLVDRTNVRAVALGGNVKILRDADGVEYQSHAYSPEAVSRLLAS